MDFQSHVVLVQQVTKAVGHFYRLGYLSDHTLAQPHTGPLPRIVDEHKAAFLFAQKNDDARKLNVRTPHLRIGTNADLQAVPGSFLPKNRLLYRFLNRQLNSFAVKFSPFHE